MTAAETLQPNAPQRELTGFLRRLPSRLRDRRFWMTQAMVLAIATAHGLIEAHGRSALLVGFHHVSVVLYTIPVVYAGLNFGWEGGILTGVLATLLTVPNLVLWHRADFAWAGELVETVMIMVVGSALGLRVEQERTLRRRVQDYAGRLVQAQEAERTRIARDLHDDSVQSLVLVCRGLDRLLNNSACPAAAEGPLHDLRHQVQDVADGLRRFSTDLRPAILDDLGLAAGLQWLASDLEQRTGIRALFEVRGRVRRLDRDKELAVFRIAQEALRNVEKHSHATRVRGCLSFRRGSISASIDDDGAGFAASGGGVAEHSEHLGLIGMQERARLAGGRVTIRSVAGSGTRVQLDLPNS